MGKISREMNIDLKALEHAMDDIGELEINGNVFSAAAAFAVADEKAGEFYSGTLIYLPGVALCDVIDQGPSIDLDQGPSIEEVRYYEGLAKDGLR